MNLPLNTGSIPVNSASVAVNGFTLTSASGNGPQLVPPYSGQSQTEQILVSAPGPPMEDGPRRSCYLPPPLPEAGTDYLPPPVQITDIFSAQQTWPL